MHKSCLRVKLQFFHTPDYPHTALLYLPLSAFQRNNIKSGASHVRTIFTVYVGLLCVNRCKERDMGVHCFVFLITDRLVRSVTGLICCLNKKTDVCLLCLIC